jgi:hypothetical protein
VVAGPTASVRVVQGNATAGTISVTADGAVVAGSVPYLTVSGYMPVKVGSLLAVVSPAIKPASPSVTINQPANSQNTFVLDGWGPFGTGFALLSDDMTAPTAGNAKLRIVDGTPAGAVDVFVLPAGGTPAGAPTFSNFAFNSTSSYQTLPAGNYDVFFTTAGTTTVLFHPATITLSAGQNRTLLLLNDCTPTACNTLTSFRSMTLPDLN